MKLYISNKIISAGLLFVLAIISFACQKQTAEVNKTSTEVSKTPAEIIKAQTPTESYKLLYAAIKAKDRSKIRQLMSKGSMGLAEFSASQQKKQIDDILENGFTGTTFAPSLPEIRDERIKDNFGALEVYNQKDNRWEDLPFVLEDDGWKIAIGDIMQNTYKSPGKGQAEIERESSGNSNTITIKPNTNSSNSNKINQVPPADKPKK